MPTLRKKPNHTAEDFGLTPLESEDDMFRWFLLAFLFGKPIQSKVAAKTWKVFINKQLDSPWAIAGASKMTLVTALRAGGYTRYQHVMSEALQKCMGQLISDYDGSIMYMLSIAENDDVFSKMIQKLYGVGPKTAEIFMREIEEYYARKVE